MAEALREVEKRLARAKPVEKLSMKELAEAVAELIREKGRVKIEDEVFPVEKVRIADESTTLAGLYQVIVEPLLGRVEAAFIQSRAAIRYRVEMKTPGLALGIADKEAVIVYRDR